MLTHFRRPSFSLGCHAIVGVIVVTFVASADFCLAAERRWQTGTWGVQSTTVKHPNIRRYVIDTAAFRLEVEDRSPGPRRPIDAAAGASVTFALERRTVYVRESAGVERKLRVIKKVKQLPGAGPKPPVYAALGGGHLIRAVSREGRYVTLEDGSTWEIDPVVWFETVQWEPLEQVTVRSIPEQDGYVYELDNTSEDDGAPARYLPIPPPR
jgi:hypothetical protein